MLKLGREKTDKILVSNLEGKILIAGKVCWRQCDDSHFAAATLSMNIGSFKIVVETERSSFGRVLEFKDLYTIVQQCKGRSQALIMQKRGVFHV